MEKDTIKISRQKRVLILHASSEEAKIVILPEVTSRHKIRQCHPGKNAQHTPPHILPEFFVPQEASVVDQKPRDKHSKRKYGN
jgi:hypothetical protein